ncbi:MAG: chorismate--pyruvate lyase [Lachnospiraceae bacterium]|nr:chorismate--pyruvate lyase [Lachnospiraceae bacterium]
MLFDKINYTVARLDGDYAYLQKDDEPDLELKCVARALLPAEIVEGSKLVYEMMEYSLLQ